MKKITTLLLTMFFLLAGGTVIMFAQPTIEDEFFEEVDYAGAFGTSDWTEGWANWTPQATEYPAATDIIAAGDITTDLTLTSDKVYLLDGWVYVKSGSTVTIEPGTVIRGSKANKGTLIIEKGAKITAEGTVDNPIVFTSNQDAGSRSYGDWGGVIVLGNAQVNKTDPVIEGGPSSTYGGSDNADNSGILKYVRIEFPGIAFQPDKEINGLTFGGVGSGTEVDYVQVSFSGDDSYEWFGGAVNAKHLIAFRGWDDDFDTDYGFGGKVQFAVSLRDPAIADPGSGSNSFESDNDGTGTDATPVTRPIFSNISSFGPLVTPETGINANFRRAMHLRRNTQINIYNSLFAGWPTGVFVDGELSQASATGGDLNVRNTLLAGITVNYAAAFDSTFFVTEEYENQTLASNDDLMIADPFNLDTPDFLPETGSPVLTASYWYEDIIDAVDGPEVSNIKIRAYPNPSYGSARLNFELATESYVSVKLYDMTGTAVSAISEIRNAGSHEIELTLKQKGIYLAEIMINNNRQVIKLVSR